jgi:branched-chain amino acid transport system permease protein
MSTVAGDPMARIDWRRTTRIGILTGLIAIYLCLVGIVEVFSTRDLIADVITLGQTALVLTAVGAGFLATRGQSLKMPAAAVAGAAAGALTGACLAVLVAVANVVSLRGVLLHADPVTFDVVSMGFGQWALWVPILALALIGGLTGLLLAAPTRIREPVTAVMLWLLVMGMFAGLIRPPLLASSITENLGRLLFASDGLTVTGAIFTVVAILGGRIVRQLVGTRARVAAITPERRRVVQPIVIVLGLLFVLWLPQGVGSFFAQVVAVVALYVLMGFGLNITLGLAGLLDLGFVAFFAVGAYTVGLLTSTAEYGIAQWPFWAAVPFAVIIAMAFGAFFGLPILGIRGDYLAIATLGFGEIIRLLVG